jgi:indole-3-glycerol phosphate synthase
MPAILDKIILSKKEGIKRNKEVIPLEEIQRLIPNLPPTKDFKAAISQARNRRAFQIKIIAEIKKASPSRGVIREDFDPVEIAKIYERNGASAISVLTEERYFLGSLDYLKAVRGITRLPLLCKDFIIDPYQIYQAKFYGADAVLLITSILESSKLKEFIKIAKGLSLAPLVEVHTINELKKALKTEPEIIGINNRNLKTFMTDIQTTFKLLPFIPQDTIVISESGFNNRKDLTRFKGKRIHAFLIGEALIREKDIAKKLRELLLSKSRKVNLLI